MAPRSGRDLGLTIELHSLLTVFLLAVARPTLVVSDLSFWNGVLLEWRTMHIVLRLVGAFYAFAGYIILRQALTSRLIDHAIAAITFKKPKGLDRAQTLYQLLLAGVVFTGGIALVLLLEPAAWLFALGTIIQIIYLTWLAPHFFDHADPPDAAGRQRSINAFVLYAAATAFVVWASLTGRLLQLREVPLALRLAGATTVLGLGVYAARMFKRPLGSAATLGAWDGEDQKPFDPSSLSRVKVMADYQCNPLWAMEPDVYGDFPPEALNLSPQLCKDLGAWADAYTASFNPADPITSRWGAAEQARHMEQGNELARRLKMECPHLAVFVFDASVGVREVQA